MEGSIHLLNVRIVDVSGYDNILQNSFEIHTIDGGGGKKGSGRGGESGSRVGGGSGVRGGKERAAVVLSGRFFFLI